MHNEKIRIAYEKDFIKRKDIDDRLLLVMAYLKINTNMKGELGTTLETIVNDIGYIPDKHKGKINSVIIQQLEWLESHNYVSILKDSKTITPKGFIKISINKSSNIYDMDYIDSQDNACIKPHVIISEREYNKITKSKTRANKGILLRTFLTVKSYINFDPSTPNICFPSQATIAKNCNKSTGYTINNAIQELVDLKLLYVHITGGYKDKDGNVRNANNVYAVDPRELKGVNQTMLEYYNNECGIKIDSFIK